MVEDFFRIALFSDQKYMFSKLDLREIILTIPGVLLPSLFKLKLHYLKYVCLILLLSKTWRLYLYLHSCLLLRHLAYSLRLIMFYVQFLHLLLVVPFSRSQNIIYNLEYVFSWLNTGYIASIKLESTCNTIQTARNNPTMWGKPDRMSTRMCSLRIHIDSILTLEKVCKLLSNTKYQVQLFSS